MVVKQGWCGHLCPLGAFYSLVGHHTAQIRVKFDQATCTGCGDCQAICPEPQVLNLNRLAEDGQVLSGECTNCARCVPICPEKSLAFGWRLGKPGSGPVGAQHRLIMKEDNP
ncbi:4Fe-4S dicluster domain-containing protein [Thiocapsa sp.]|uniref:4Fe-4S dicluster domain-containing protein n=1 Tax=Thiocapsa sp. TaxID=2024551 RepID=UPI003592F582